MSVKNLYVFISNGGDGSYYTKYTFDGDLVEKLEHAYGKGLMDCESDLGCDGDGFHYCILTVPDTCTYSTLDISEYQTVEGYYDGNYPWNREE